MTLAPRLRIAYLGLSRSWGVPGASLAIFLGKGTHREKHHPSLKVVALLQLAKQNDPYNVDKKAPYRD